MEIDRDSVPSHQPRDAPYVIDVGVRQDDGLGFDLPRIEKRGDPLRLGARIYDHHVVTGSHEETVGLEGTHRNGPDLEAGVSHAMVRPRRTFRSRRSPLRWGFRT